MPQDKRSRAKRKRRGGDLRGTALEFLFLAAPPAARSALLEALRGPPATARKRLMGLLGRALGAGVRGGPSRDGSGTLQAYAAALPFVVLLEYGLFLMRLEKLEALRGERDGPVRGDRVLRRLSQLAVEVASGWKDQPRSKAEIARRIGVSRETLRRRERKDEWVAGVIRFILAPERELPKGYVGALGPDGIDW